MSDLMEKKWLEMIAAFLELSPEERVAEPKGDVEEKSKEMISLKLLKAAVILPLKRVPLVKDVSREPGETGIGDVSCPLSVVIQ